MFTKELLLILFIFSFGISTAQNEGKKVKIGSVGAYDMGNVKCEKENNLYKITFENQNEVQVNDYDDFSIKAEDFEEVFVSLMNGFEDKNKKEIHIPTETNYVELDYTKFIGKMRVRFTVSKKKNALGVSYSAWLTQKEAKKLFGK